MQSPSPDAHTSSPGYRERVTPPIGVWAIGAGTALLLGIAFFPLGVEYSAVVGALGLVFAGAALWLTSPVVEVSGGALRAGRARVDLRFTGEASARDREQTSLLRGTEYSPLSFHCQRSWIPASVTVDIVDEGDPTPYWLISTRDPAALAAAVRAGRAAAIAA